jgi:hypothetical protein
MRELRTRRVLIAGATGVLLGLAPLAAGAQEPESQPAAQPERKAWDAESMSQLSGELAESMAAVRQAFRREPGYRDPNNPNRRAMQKMEQTLKSLEKSTRQLRNRVKAGGGYQETQGIARRIGMLLNDADVEGRKIMTSAWMDEEIQPAMKLINQIAPYYGKGPLYDPETMQRLDRAPNPKRAKPKRANPCQQKP